VSKQIYIYMRQMAVH